MQNLKPKRNYQIESLLIEGDFQKDAIFFEKIEKKLEETVNPDRNPRSPFHFCEKAHTLHEYIEIADLLYSKNLQKTVKSHTPIRYMQYEIQKEDTLYGLALKFNVSPESIKNLNFLSEQSPLFPGQIISISKQITEESIDFSETREFPLESLENWLNSQEKEEECKELEKKLKEPCLEDIILRKKSSENDAERLSKLLIRKQTENFEEIQYEVYYCTTYREIKGILSINDNSLRFEPLEPTSFNDKACTNSLNFSVFLEIADIVEAFMINLPNKYCDEKLYNENTKNFNKDFFVEINVSRIGDKAIEQRYEERIHVMSVEKLPLATIFFKIYDYHFEEELTNSQKFSVASEIQKKLSEKLFKPRETHQNPRVSATRIPFFDIIYENLFKTSSKKSQRAYKTRPMLKNLRLFGVLPQEPSNEEAELEEIPEYIPKLVEDSDVLTNEHFLQILDYIPPSLKLRNWRLIYSNIKHGTSLTTLFYRCEDIGPNILVLQDFKGWVFGAFCSSSWVRTQSFYGKGESFLFSFGNTKKIRSFPWTGKNYHFQFADSDGIVVGAGDRFGLFVKKDLLAGTSHCCDTFENDVLSEGHDFEIRFIEIWACDEFIEF